jgi:hypothetical protein
VNVPNTDSRFPYQVYKVDQITTSANIAPQVTNYSMVGGSSGLFQITSVAFTRSANFTYGCSGADFATSLKNLYGSALLSSIVSRIIYDSSQNVITTISGAARIEYIATIYWASNNAITTFLS